MLLLLLTLGLLLSPWSTSGASAQEGDPTTTTSEAPTTTTSEATTTTASTTTTIPAPSVGEASIHEALQAQRTEQGFALALVVFSLGMLCGIKAIR